MRTTKVHCTPVTPRRPARYRLLPRLLVLSLVLGAVPVSAIVIRHDRADADYVVEAGSYPQFFHLQQRRQRKVCLATLISARWAITAGHCTEDTPLREQVESGAAWRVSIAGKAHEVVGLVLHPDYRNGDALAGVDLALLQLREPVTGIAPLQLHRKGDELHRVASLIGWGYTGNGASGRRVNDGKLRLAHNAVAEAGQWLVFHFDDPRLPGSSALHLEGIPGLGDSGGPAFVDNGKEPVLLGVAVGEMAGSPDRGPEGRYGAVEVYERIFLHLDWIEAVLAAEPRQP